MSDFVLSVRKQLFSMQDEKYRLFQCKLLPTIDPETVIGIRTPALRRYAKELSGLALCGEFLRDLPHKYYEENNLHAFLLEQCKDFQQAVEGLETFLPYVDNWATCDMMNPKVLGKFLPALLDTVQKWIASDHPYTVRYAIGLLMRYYLEDQFSADYLELVASVHSQEYYVRMMVAWYFATALIKQYDAALPYLLEHRLELWTHNKAIQKAVESDRIPEEVKPYLKSQKRKETK